MEGTSIRQAHTWQLEALAVEIRKRTCGSDGQPCSTIIMRHRFEARSEITKVNVSGKTKVLVVDEMKKVPTRKNNNALQGS